MDLNEGVKKSTMPAKMIESILLKMLSCQYTTDTWISNSNLPLNIIVDTHLSMESEIHK